MERPEIELLKRAEELLLRSEKTGRITATVFLTPAEQYAIEKQEKAAGRTPLFYGGAEGCERRLCFFVPEYLDEEPEYGDFIAALSVKVGFGEPGHRDYLGALMGLGIKREWIGDIRIKDGTATVFVLPSVLRHIKDSLVSVGRYGAKVEELPLSKIPPAEIKRKSVCFSVKSPRLDAVCAALFGVSRSTAASAIGEGLVSLNYSPCFKCDAPVKTGDTLSYRGKGKALIGDPGGRSRKDRLFVNAEIYE